MVSNLEYSSKIITIMYNHTINEGLELVIEYSAYIIKMV